MKREWPVKDMPQKDIRTVFYKPAFLRYPIARKWIDLGLDHLLLFLSWTVAYIFLENLLFIPLPFAFFFLTTIWISYSVFSLWTDSCAMIYRYTDIKEMIKVMGGFTLSIAISATLSLFLTSGARVQFILLVYFLSLLVTGGKFVFVKAKSEMDGFKKKRQVPVRKIRTLVVGAGDGGSLFIKNSQKHLPEIQLIGIVDDDAAKHHMRVFGVPILGGTADIPYLVAVQEIEQITIAIPSLVPEDLERILELCNQSQATVNLMPSIEDVVSGKLSVQRFREVDVVDLLGRDEVTLDTKQLARELSGKTLLISGAGGSIGSEISRILASFSPQKLILLGHGENSIYQIHRELNKRYGGKIEIIPVIADVKDRARMFEVMKLYKPDIVYHAAAHKHVPMMELNTAEAVKNNVYGTKNIAEASKAAGVGTFVMVSTDKAVNPPNVMGATKRLAEMIVTSLNEPGGTNFAAVRFGNVLGSRGSVVPLFREQIKAGGPVTVTDFRMTRYFMTIPEASRLVIQAGALAKGGEIFVLDMGKPVRIVDLARKMVQISGYTDNEIEVVETGIRPGEKLYEELLIASENTGEKVFDKIFVGKAVQKPLTDIVAFLQMIEGENEKTLRDDLITYARLHQQQMPKEEKQPEIEGIVREKQLA
ncbi:polysaccharide biosynthesis protein [Desemzia sp. FAM 23989]|uniref:polysaccharide biosynthesis protein n=1 Tax=Desemzia sp. FAM 23989 TaxID=3259523 RepID=UPI003889EA6B